MLCCAGLIGGLALGQALGGLWTVIAPAAGFAMGVAADVRFMHRHRQKWSQQPPTRDVEPQGKTGKIDELAREA